MKSNYLLAGHKMNLPDVSTLSLTATVEFPSKKEQKISNYIGTNHTRI